MQTPSCFFFIFLNNNKTEKASGRKTIGIITKGMLIDEKKWGGGGGICYVGKQARNEVRVYLSAAVPLSFQ